MATFLNNSAGACDTAKRFIEFDGMRAEDGSVSRMGSPEHAAALVGDMVGDPFKDTAGPALHMPITLLATITLVLTPLLIAAKGKGQLSGRRAHCRRRGGVRSRRQQT